ncbi:MAG: DMT family transporter [Candidatus Woesearchaeota archaeon]
MISGILATITASSELLITKLLLRSGKSKTEKYVLLHFIFATLIMLPGAFFIFSIDKKIITTYYISVFIILLISAAIYNVFYFKSVRRIPIEHSQPIILTSWVFTILLSYFYASQNTYKVILALIACFAVIIASFTKITTPSRKYEIILLISAFFIGIYNLSSRILLDIMSPFTLYFLRTLLLLPFFIVIFKFKKEDITISHMRIAIISFLSILAQVTTFWAYQSIGLVLTSLLMNLAPLITLFGARVLLKETVKPKYIIATIIVVICISLSFFV